MSGWWLYLLSERAVRNGLSAELDLKRVSSRPPRRVHDADRTVAVVDDVDVDVAFDVAADAASYSTFPGLRRVQVDHAFLAHRDHRTDCV